jgi:hypothetical protein
LACNTFPPLQAEYRAISQLPAGPFIDIKGQSACALVVNEKKVTGEELTAEHTTLAAIVDEVLKLLSTPSNVNDIALLHVVPCALAMQASNNNKGTIISLVFMILVFT